MHANAGDADDRDGFIQSLARGITVIKAFKPGFEKLTMAEVAAACGLTRAGARRILLTLQDLGYVGYEDRRFFLTSRILELGQGFLRQSLWEKTRPALQTVANTLNETASAGVLDGVDVVYTLRLRSSRMLQLELRPGAHLPAHASSMGRVLLAALPPSDLSRYFRHAEFTSYTPHTVTDPEILREKLKEVREQHWCYVRGEIDEGNGGVSVPLMDKNGDALAALNVSISNDRATMRVVKSTIVPMLQSAAAAIAADL